MLPLVEMIKKSQNGNALAQLQQQFGLDASQAEKAIEAVMPAFSTGLKRNVSTPQDFGAFMHALAEGRHEKFVDDHEAAFSDEGVNEGNGVLGHLFGSKETSRAVAAHAAQASGVGESIIKQMLPVVASMVMGGLFKQSSGQHRDSQTVDQASSNLSASNLSGGGILGQILGQLANGGIGSPNAQPNRRQAPGRANNNPLGDILEQMMGGKNNRQNSSDNSVSGDNALGKIFEEMLSGKRGGYDPDQPAPRRRTQNRDQDYRSDDYSSDDYRPDDTSRSGNDEFRDRFEPDGGFEDIGSADRYEEREPHRRERRSERNDEPRYQERSPQPKGGLEDLFGDMFETGRKVDNGYQKGIESIFDKFRKR